MRGIQMVLMGNLWPWSSYIRMMECVLKYSQFAFRFISGPPRMQIWMFADQLHRPLELSSWFLQDPSGCCLYWRKHTTNSLQCCQRWRVLWRNQNWSQVHSGGNCLTFMFENYHLHSPPLDAVCHLGYTYVRLSCASITIYLLTAYASFLDPLLLPLCDNWWLQQLTSYLDV
jgi:hypothetical protein